MLSTIEGFKKGVDFGVSCQNLPPFGTSISNRFQSALRFAGLTHS